MKKDAVVYDIDGTLADKTFYEHLLQDWDWEEFAKGIITAKIHQDVAKGMRALDNHGISIILLTARPEFYRDDTKT